MHTAVQPPVQLSLNGGEHTPQARGGDRPTTMPRAMPRAGGAVSGAGALARRKKAALAADLATQCPFSPSTNVSAALDTTAAGGRCDRTGAAVPTQVWRRREQPAERSQSPGLLLRAAVHTAVQGAVQGAGGGHDRPCAARGTRSAVRRAGAMHEVHAATQQREFALALRPLVGICPLVGRRRKASTETCLVYTLLGRRRCDDYEHGCDSCDGCSGLMEKRQAAAAERRQREASSCCRQFVAGDKSSTMMATGDGNAHVIAR